MSWSNSSLEDSAMVKTNHKSSFSEKFRTWAGPRLLILSVGAQVLFWQGRSSASSPSHISEITEELVPFVNDPPIEAFSKANYIIISFVVIFLFLKKKKIINLFIFYFFSNPLICQILLTLFHFNFVNIKISLYIRHDF